MFIEIRFLKSYFIFIFYTIQYLPNAQGSFTFINLYVKNIDNDIKSSIPINTRDILIHIFNSLDRVSFKKVSYKYQVNSFYIIICTI